VVCESNLTQFLDLLNEFQVKRGGIRTHQVHLGIHTEKDFDKHS
jgi:hypothetical protein